MSSNLPKPNANYPSSPLSISSLMPMNIPDPSLRGESFDQLLNNRGIRFIHKIAAPCPNMTSVVDNNHAPNCKICGNQGVLYFKQKEIFGVFASNSLQKNFEMQGMWEIGTAVVSLPTEYPDGEQADFNTFDQLVITDFQVRLWELLEYQPNSDGEQLLRYPIQSVEAMFYVLDNKKIDLTEGVNFTITTAGAIKWINEQTPPYNPITGVGAVLSITYFCNPIYNVLQHFRELRVTQEMVNGVKTARRLPQQILVKRDFITRLPDKEV